MTKGPADAPSRSADQRGQVVDRVNVRLPGRKLLLRAHVPPADSGADLRIHLRDGQLDVGARVRQVGARTVGQSTDATNSLRVSGITSCSRTA